MSDNLTLSPIRRFDTAKAVADRLLESIASGALTTGDRIPSEHELAERLGVGRSSIREGLRSLEQLGLVEVRPGHGRFVGALGTTALLRPDIFAAFLSDDVTQELLEAREVIESQVVSMAARRPHEEELDRVADLLLRTEVALRAGLHAYDLAAQFHVFLARTCGNRFLAQYMESLSDLLTARGKESEEAAGDPLHELAEHRALFEAVRAGDGALARSLVVAHIEGSTAVFVQARGDSAGSAGSAGSADHPRHAGRRR